MIERHGEMYRFLDKFHTKKAYIIKRKTKPLDVSLYESNPSLGLRIVIDSDHFSVNSIPYRISNIKTIYVTKVNGDREYRGTCFHLNIIKQNELITTPGEKKHDAFLFCELTNNDAKKLTEVFDYFIFSNEKDIKKLTSKDYTPIINNSHLKYDFTLNRYENKNIVPDEIIKKQDIEYCLYEILPKSYYNFYIKDNKLFYESKYLNSNYMDVWIEKKILKKEAKINKILKILKFSIFSIILAIIVIPQILVDTEVWSLFLLFIITISYIIFCLHYYE